MPKQMKEKKFHKISRKRESPGDVKQNFKINYELFTLRRYDREILICVVLILATLAVYAQVYHHTFINLDDYEYVHNNPMVRAGLTLQGIVWAFTSFYQANWHPLTWLSHMLDCQLYGINAGAHLLTNLLLHILNTLLLFLVFRRMTHATWRSAVVAALFALHPLHVESVAWVAERKDVLSTFFWMLTLWAYVHYTEVPTSWKRYFLVILFLAVGLMAKPMLVTLPFVLLLLDYWPLGRLRWKSSHGLNVLRSSILGLVREKLPLFGLITASSILTYLAQQHGGAVISATSIPLSSRISNALMAYISYIGKMIWPSSLAVYYPYVFNIPSWQSTTAGLLLVCITALAIWEAKRRAYLVAGWFWYLGTLVPVIGLVQVGEQSMADRYTYVPLIGLFIMIVWGMGDLLSRWRYQRVGVAVATGILLLVLGVCSWFQVGLWRDSITLFGHTLAVTSDNWVIQYDLGYALLKAGREDEAAMHFKEVLRIVPNDPYSIIKLGDILVRQGEYKEAVTLYSQALNFYPNFPKLHRDIGVAFVNLGRYEEAITHLSEAVRLEPTYADAQRKLGVVLLQQGKYQEAASHLSEVIRLTPNDAKAHTYLGLTLFQQGKNQEAIDEYSTALRLNSNDVEAQNSLKEAQSKITPRKNG